MRGKYPPRTQPRRNIHNYWVYINAWPAIITMYHELNKLWKSYRLGKLAKFLLAFWFVESDNLETNNNGSMSNTPLDSSKLGAGPELSAFWQNKQLTYRPD